MTSHHSLSKTVLVHQHILSDCARHCSRGSELLTRTDKDPCFYQLYTNSYQARCCLDTTCPCPFTILTLTLMCVLFLHTIKQLTQF